jgi:hypothetical protein
MYIGDGFFMKMSVTVTDMLLALATLGNATRDRIISICSVRCPRWLVAKASCQLSMAITVADVIAVNFANGNMALKFSFAPKMAWQLKP